MRRIANAALCWTAMAAACALTVAQTIPNQPPPPSQSAQSAAQALPAQPLAVQSLANQIAAMVAEPAVARAHWGVMVTALDGTPIYTLNEGQLFQPDSNTKLFTTAAAMALLGPNKTFETVVAIIAPIKKGTIHGDLYLVGGGDSNFGAHDVPYASPSPKPSPSQEKAIPDVDSLADQIVAKGVRKIGGDIVGDDTLFQWRPYPPGWSWDDLIWGYGAPVSALSIHDNSIEATLAPGSDIGASATPTVPYYAFSNKIMVSYGGKRDCNTIRLTSLGSRELLVDGALPVGAAPCAETLAIQDPAEYAAIALKRALEERGVQISGSAQAAYDRTPSGDRSAVSVDGLSSGPRSANTAGGGCLTIVSDGPNVEVIARHRSPPLGADVTFTNKVSQNLHAEMLLRNIGQIDCDDSGAYPVALRRFLTGQAGIDKDDFVFFDGSGLSAYDLATPRATAKLLSFAAHDPKTGVPQPWFADWKASLPIGGVDGTLADRFNKPPLKGHVFAKTGSHSEANALSGYLDCASGRSVIFSIFVDHHLPGDTAERAVIDRIVAAIAATE